MEYRASHSVVLTHRTELKDHEVDVGTPGRHINHPRQQISGTLKGFTESVFIIENAEFGLVRVETHKRMFKEREEELRASVGKKIDIAIDKTGKNMSVAVHRDDGVHVLRDHFQTPMQPIGLMPLVYRNGRGGAKDIYGVLTHVHGANLIEMKTDKGSVLIAGKAPDMAHQREIQKMLGHEVTVKTNRTLTVVDRTPQQQKGLSR
jgi:hypothetical protein